MRPIEDEIRDASHIYCHGKGSTWMALRWEQRSSAPWSTAKSRFRSKQVFSLDLSSALYKWKVKKVSYFDADIFLGHNNIDLQCCQHRGGVARVYPGGRVAHPGGQNEDENGKSLRKNKKYWSKFEERRRKVELLPTWDCEAGYWCSEVLATLYCSDISSKMMQCGMVSAQFITLSFQYSVPLALFPIPVREVIINTNNLLGGQFLKFFSPKSQKII